MKDTILKLRDNNERKTQEPLFLSFFVFLLFFCLSPLSFSFASFHFARAALALLNSPFLFFSFFCLPCFCQGVSEGSVRRKFASVEEAQAYTNQLYGKYRFLENNLQMEQRRYPDPCLALCHVHSPRLSLQCAHSLTEKHNILKENIEMLRFLAAKPVTIPKRREEKRERERERRRRRNIRRKKHFLTFSSKDRKDIWLEVETRRKAISISPSLFFFFFFFFFFFYSSSILLLFFFFYSSSILLLFFFFVFLFFSSSVWQSSDEVFVTEFKLADNLYTTARIRNTEKISMWLGVGFSLKNKEKKKKKKRRRRRRSVGVDHGEGGQKNMNMMEKRKKDKDGIRIDGHSGSRNCVCFFSSLCCSSFPFLSSTCAVAHFAHAGFLSFRRPM